MPIEHGFPRGANFGAHKPYIEGDGFIFCHDMACPIMHQSGEKAVLNLNEGCFEPCWKAQEEGWKTVQAKTWLQKKILKWFFDV